jgi:hypothetical protein
MLYSIAFSLITRGLYTLSQSFVKRSNRRAVYFPFSHATVGYLRHCLNN